MEKLTAVNFRAAGALKLGRVLVGMMLALAITACDPLFGVRTDANLAHPVDTGCVDRTLRSVPGAGTVEHSTHGSEYLQILPDPGRAITVRSDEWTYGGDGGGWVQILYDGTSITYFNGRMKMGEPLPEADLDAFVPLMTRVNVALEQSCGLPLRSAGKVSRN